MTQSNIFCLLGPTAAGKTQLALALAQKFPIEIVSVDSALIYRDMNIGTAKPDVATMKAIPHHLIDICDPSESYSVAQFKQDAEFAISDILQRNKIPLLVGGTMMYFNMLRKGIAELPSADPGIRQRLTKEAALKGWPRLHARLLQVDPVSAARIHAQDGQRIQRALEVFLQSGRNLTDWLANQTSPQLPYHMHTWIVAPTSRVVLHERIAARFEQMFQAGFVEEVRHLYERGDLSLENPSMRSVGYRQVWQYLAGEYSLNEAREKGIIATRQLAKRQFTWLRRFTDVLWFDALDPNLFDRLCTAMF